MEPSGDKYNLWKMKYDFFRLIWPSFELILKLEYGFSKAWIFENISYKFCPNKCHRTLGNWVWSKTHRKASKSEVYNSSNGRIFKPGQNWVKQTHWTTGTKKNAMSFCCWAKTTCHLHWLWRAPKESKWHIVFPLTEG